MHSHQASAGPCAKRRQGCSFPKTQSVPCGPLGLFPVLGLPCAISLVWLHAFPSPSPLQPTITINTQQKWGLGCSFKAEILKNCFSPWEPVGSLWTPSQNNIFKCIIKHKIFQWKPVIVIYSYQNIFLKLTCDKVNECFFIDLNNKI